MPQLRLPLGQPSLTASSLNTIAQGLETGKANPYPTPLKEVLPIKVTVDVSHIWPEGDPITRASRELSETIVGLQSKLNWPDYQKPYEKARTAILSSYGLTHEVFCAEITKRVAQERALKYPRKGTEQ